uniref:Uncharacterized protein n=1 Tax=Cacopsylla melanoneura TaxID=428564 RepID=A0A8D8ZA07_9HEMI
MFYAQPEWGRGGIKASITWMVSLDGRHTLGLVPQHFKSEHLTRFFIIFKAKLAFLQNSIKNSRFFWAFKKKKSNFSRLENSLTCRYPARRVDFRIRKVGVLNSQTRHIIWTVIFIIEER